MAVVAGVTVIVYETMTNNQIVKVAREETVRLDITQPVTADLTSATLGRLIDDAKENALSQLEDLVRRS